jgi:benzoate/toluate 1,2-dioxygenase subunit beta
MVDDQTYLAVQRFLSREAQALDDGAWEDWLALYREDAHYWMPAYPDQTDPLHEASLVYDNATLRTLKVRRLRSGDALSLTGSARMVRQISNLTVRQEGDTIKARASLSAFQFARGTVQSFHGKAQWTLVRQDGDYQIALKRVDLITAGQPISDILFYL